MKFDEIMRDIESLANSQGFYGRLLRDLKELEECDLDSYNKLKKEWEDMNFKDSVDFILYLEG